MTASIEAVDAIHCQKPFVEERPNDLSSLFTNILLFKKTINQAFVITVFFILFV